MREGRVGKGSMIFPSCTPAEGRTEALDALLWLDRAVFRCDTRGREDVQG